MKIVSLLSAVLVLGLVPAYSQEKPEGKTESAGETPVPGPPQLKKLSKAEASAVEAYKADMLSAQKWIGSYGEETAGSTAAEYRLPAKLAGRLAEVHTKGLPANLTKALAALRSNLTEQAALVKELPADETAAATWLKNKEKDKAFDKARTVLLDQQARLETALIDAGISCGAGVESDLYQTSGLAQIKDRWVVILGAYKKYPEAKEDAMKIAKASRVPFSMRGMVYDKKGLHYPKDLEDEPYAGEYLLRRDNFSQEDGKDLEKHVSVEISGEYEGFAPGYFIPVGYIAGTAADAENMAAEFKKHAPGTYVKKTRIYMGCLH